MRIYNPALGSKHGFEACNPRERIDIDIALGPDPFKFKFKFT